MEKKNYILNLYPTTKLLMIMAIIVSTFIIPGYIYAYMCFPICILIAYRCGKLKEFLKFVKSGLLFLIIAIFIMQCFFFPGNEVIWKWSVFSIKREGVLYGLNMTSKILAIGSSFILFFRITTIKDFVASLENMGMSPKATYVILATLQMIPEMKKQSTVIMDAQKTRGVETEGNMISRAKAFIPTLGPLVLSSIASTEERAITLESRAFSAPIKKTHLYNIEKSKDDKVVRYILAAFLILCIVGRVVLWR